MNSNNGFDPVQNQNEPNPIQSKNTDSDLNVEITDLNPEKGYTALGINQPYETMIEALNELINTPNSLEKYNFASEMLTPSRKIEFNLKDISASNSTSASSTFALILNSNVIGLTVINCAEMKFLIPNSIPVAGTEIRVRAQVKERPLYRKAVEEGGFYDVPVVSTQLNCEQIAK